MTIERLRSISPNSIDPLIGRDTIVVNGRL
jgi:hypothetical protein